MFKVFSIGKARSYGCKLSLELRAANCEGRTTTHLQRTGQLSRLSAFDILVCWSILPKEASSKRLGWLPRLAWTDQKRKRGQCLPWMSFCRIAFASRVDLLYLRAASDRFNLAVGDSKRLRRRCRRTSESVRRILWQLC